MKGVQSYNPLLWLVSRKKYGIGSALVLANNDESSQRLKATFETSTEEHRRALLGEGSTISETGHSGCGVEFAGP